MTFDQALQSVFKRHVSTLRDSICSGHNCCVFGIKYSGREVFCDLLLALLRKEKGLKVICATLDDPDFDDKEQAIGDIRNQFVLSCLNELHSPRGDVGRPFLDNFNTLKSEFKSCYKKQKKRIVVVVRRFDNVRYLKPELLRAFFVQLHKLHKCVEAGHPLLVWESSRALPVLQACAPQIYRSTAFMDSFDPQYYYWVRPLSADEVKSVLKKMGKTSLLADLPMVMSQTMGISGLVRAFVGMERSKFYAEFRQVAEWIVGVDKEQDIPPADSAQILVEYGLKSAGGELPLELRRWLVEHKIELRGAPGMIGEDMVVDANDSFDGPRRFGLRFLWKDGVLTDTVHCLSYPGMQGDRLKTVLMFLKHYDKYVRKEVKVPWMCQPKKLEGEKSVKWSNDFQRTPYSEFRKAQIAMFSVLNLSGERSYRWMIIPDADFDAASLSKCGDRRIQESYFRNKYP